MTELSTFVYEKIKEEAKKFCDEHFNNPRLEDYVLIEIAMQKASILTVKFLKNIMSEKC